MKNKIICDAERVQKYIEHRDQYHARIEAVKAKIRAAETDLRRAKTGLERIQVAFIDDATKYPGQPYEGVFRDGAGGFVHVTAQKASRNSHGSKSVLVVEKVTQ